MSSLVTILVIMMLTVVYNESQYVAEYQDDYEKIIPKNTRPFELCDEGLNTKMCKTTKIWRELLKTPDELFDNAHDFSREYAHDYIDEEESPTIGQKRNSMFKNADPELDDCLTTKIHIDLRTDYFPSVIASITCNYTANDQRRWPRYWSCQPVEYTTTVMSRKFRDNITKDISEDSKACWLRKIPIHKARVQSKRTFVEDTNDVASTLQGCWQFEKRIIHAGCRLKYMGP